MRRKGSVVATAFLVVGLAAAVAAPAAAQTQRFPDVPADHYAFEAIAGLLRPA